MDFFKGLLAVTVLIGFAGAASATPSECDAVSGNLVLNCGFETGDFTDWNTAGDNNTFVASSFDEGPNSGTFFAALGNVGFNGIVSQIITDTAGASYTLSYWFASDGGLPNYFEADWNGTTLPGSVESNVGAFGYQNFTFKVTGTGSDTLTFLERNDPAWQALDDISLVPEPASVLLFGTALAFGFGVARRGKRA